MGNKESGVLALKYRPQKFGEVVGQDTTISQVQAAAKNLSLGHALIFAGTRGSGKTTTARILAKYLNCEKVHSRRPSDAPSVKSLDEPCGECQSCGMIESGVSMSVTEIDAASNTGVDNIREIIESVRYSVKGHRVIILDEAHMLSKNAFNSLLKTLEEPPPGVTFILLTTEPHKLIPTVKSRCQMYEFHDISVKTLETYYQEVSDKEGLKILPEQIHQIALRAEGSVRDGLSILQKYLSGGQVEDTGSEYFELMGALYQGDATTSLALVGELRKKEDARLIVQTLERWIYYCSLENFGMKTPIRQFLGDKSSSFDLKHLQKMFDTCIEIERAFSATPNSKSVLDMGIIKLTL